MELGQFDDAVFNYRQALKIKPDYADAHFNLGNVLMELGQFDGAVASYRQAIEIKPDFTSAYINLGGALQELGQLYDAAANYRVAIELKPGFAKTLANLALVMSDLEQLDGATEYFARALKIDPDCVEARLGLAKLSIQRGDISEAEEMLQSVLKTYPANLEARFLIAKVNKVTSDSENFTALQEFETAARNGKLSISRSQTIGLHFALGKCFDDIGNYDSAFSYFSEGCKQKRATLKYDAAKTTKLHNDIIRVFSQETLDRLRGGGSSSSLPIFVLGMPRSGTTLTEQIIASHPKVYGAGELQYMPIISNRDVAGIGVDFPNNITALDRGILSTWAADYVTEIRRHAPNSKYITDKLPHNFAAIGLIHLMFPNAKIIHVNRNPVDTCLSCFTNLFANNNLEYTYDLAELGGYYANYARLMEHWRTVLPADAFFEVQYEDIVFDLELHARKIIRYCGLDWDDACINFHKSERFIHTSSMSQVRQPIYKSSVERWKSYRKYLGPLLDTLDDFVPKIN